APRLLSYRVQHVVGSNEQPASRNRWRSQLPVVEFVLCKNARGAAGGKNDGFTTLAEEVDPAITGKRRSTVDASDTLLPDAFSGLRVRCRRDADVAHHIDQPVVIDQRRNVRSARLHFPDHMAF